MEKNIITFEQLQIILGVKESTIKTLIKENDFPESVFCKNGRVIQFNLEALLNWFESMEAEICQY
jgi:predicted DNA-binding transcriptional regulator AlpA